MVAIARLLSAALLSLPIRATSAGEETMPTWTAIKSAFLKVFPTTSAMVFAMLWIFVIVAWQLGHAIGWL